MIHVTPRIQHIGLQNRGIGLANVSISDYLVAAGSPLNNSETSQYNHKGEINFYQIKSSVRVTDFAIPNFERTFIGTAGGNMKKLQIKKGNDYFFNKYSTIYNEIRGIPLNIGAGSTFGKYLDALLDFEPRYIRDGPGIIMDTQVRHNIAGNFWYSVYKDFKDNQDINTLPWRVGGNELNSETEITNSNWGSTYFKTKKNVKINRICSILIFKITNTNQQPKSDVIANIRTENDFDKLEVFQQLMN